MHEAVRAVAAGVEDLSDDVKSKVKDRIRFHADARDKAVIKNVKKADELGWGA
jgi:uncharacterized protein YggE